MPSVVPRTDDEWNSLYFRAGEVFSPAAPIDRRDLFAGRAEQLTELLDAVYTRGQHGVVYGTRGVGKTSLVSILDFLPGESIAVIRENCKSDDTFARAWNRAFETVVVEAGSDRITHGKQTKIRMTEIIDEHLRANATPDQIVLFLRRLDQPVVFVFDEFDQIKDTAVTQAFAEVIKALSDYAAVPKLVLVGVGESVSDLISAHSSVERALRQIPMPRMPQSESSEILDKALSILGMGCVHAAKVRIARMSQGLPHYVHSIGLRSARSALQDFRSTMIDLRAVNVGIQAALGDASRSLLDDYMAATTTPRREALFKLVLVACALAETDELGRFAPAAVREPLRAMGKPLDIPAFSPHLNKFASPDRGGVLEKLGTARRYRFRFRKPMLAPFVAMQGIKDQLIGAELAERLLSRDDQPG